jgi:hypothetical protein
VTTGAQLGGEVLTMELVVEEDMGTSAAARLPVPEVRARLEGDPYVLCRLARPGQRVGLSLPVVPALGAEEVTVSWRAFACEGPGIFARSRSDSWAPPSSELGPADPRAFPPPERGGSRANLRVELTRWRPWTSADRVGEVLIHKDAFAQLRAISGKATARVEVRAATFGLGDALAQAKLQGPVAAAVRLADDRWVIQREEGWWVVGADGAPRHGAGQLFPFALDLARSGSGGFLWYEHHARPKVAEALRAAGFVRGEGKGLAVEVTAESLVPFLELLAEHGLGLAADGIGPLPR